MKYKIAYIINANVFLQYGIILYYGDVAFIIGIEFWRQTMIKDTKYLVVAAKTSVVYKLLTQSTVHRIRIRTSFYFCYVA